MYCHNALLKKINKIVFFFYLYIFFQTNKRWNLDAPWCGFLLRSFVYTEIWYEMRVIELAKYWNFHCSTKKMRNKILGESIEIYMCFLYSIYFVVIFFSYSTFLKIKKKKHFFFLFNINFIIIFIDLINLLLAFILFYQIHRLKNH